MLALGGITARLRSQDSLPTALRLRDSHQRTALNGPRNGGSFPPFPGGIVWSGKARFSLSHMYKSEHLAEKKDSRETVCNCVLIFLYYHALRIRQEV